MLNEAQKVEMAFSDHIVTPWLNLAAIQAFASLLAPLPALLLGNSLACDWIPLQLFLPWAANSAGESSI